MIITLKNKGHITLRVQSSTQQRFYKVKQFISLVINNFFNDDCPYRASALAFTTLLALIPLMTVGFIILSAFPVFQTFSRPIQTFIFENFVPTTGKLIHDYLIQFMTQVPRLSILGITFLFITAILLMVTIEHAMNKIWRVDNSRKGVAAFLLYWAILSLGPVFLGLSLAASSYFLSIIFFNSAIVPTALTKIVPGFFSFTGFTLLFFVVPNCKVHLKDALLGGLVATLLFESAKQAFGLYLSYYNTYELLYGAFAAIPIFFIWVYWLWIITLLGAEVSYASSVYHRYHNGQPIDGFSHALLWLNELWLTQKEGKGLLFNELLSTSNQPFIVDNTTILNELKRINIIDRNEEGQLLLSRDLNETSLHWLSQQLSFSLPVSSDLNQSGLHEVWQTILTRKEKALEQILSISLAELFEEANRSKTPLLKS